MTARTARSLAALAAALLAQSVWTKDARAQAPDAAAQIAQAVMAAPEGARAGARVLGFRDDGTTVTLRRGTNDLVCIADNPTDEAWSVACYPTSIDPYMARGRELREGGLTDRNESLRRRWAEADAGTLAMPDQPATVFILHGKGWDTAAGQVIEPFLRWAIYTPWATPESTGLPAEPGGPGAPWLMYPGTPGAHIMITPPAPGGSA